MATHLEPVAMETARGVRGGTPGQPSLARRDRCSPGGKGGVERCRGDGLGVAGISGRGLCIHGRCHVFGRRGPVSVGVSLSQWAWSCIRWACPYRSGRGPVVSWRIPIPAGVAL